MPISAGPAQSTARAGDAAGLPAHYAEREHLVIGNARLYGGSVAGPAKRLDTEVEYVTRILVRYPRDVDRFTGRVVVEPFNTSNGADADALWAKVGSLLVAQGDAWVGVSERVSSQHELGKHDAVRYADIQLPSNDVAWDVLAQVGELVRDRERGPLAGFPVGHVYLGGYSQSGSDTASFAMAIHPNARLADGAAIFNGYFPAAHSGSITSLASGTLRLPPFEHVAMTKVDVPVVDLETQTDVEGFTTVLGDGRVYTATGGAHVRRADSDTPGDLYRLYEVAGAPHAANRPGCDGEGSSFPTSMFMRAALAALFRWAELDVAPPTAGRIELATVGVVSAARLDPYGNAVGGIRSPLVDTPLARYEVHAGSAPRCCLVGRETAIPGEVLISRYGQLETYLREFSDSLEATIAAGFLLPADGVSLLAEMTGRAQRAFRAAARSASATQP